MAIGDLMTFHDVWNGLDCCSLCFPFHFHNICLWNFCNVNVTFFKSVYKIPSRSCIRTMPAMFIGSPFYGSTTLLIGPFLWPPSIKFHVMCFTFLKNIRTLVYIKCMVNCFYTGSMHCQRRNGWQWCLDDFLKPFSEWAPYSMGLVV